MKNLKYRVLLFGTVVILASCYDNQRAKNFNNKTTIDHDALVFVATAGESGLTEIKASMLAETMSKNPRIIQLAKMMVKDHTAAGKDLSALAKDKLVNKSDTLSLEHQKTIDSLAKLTKTFDFAYVNLMVKDHSAAINLFKAAATNKNNAVQQLARKILPTLQMHLDSANAICVSLK